MTIDPDDYDLRELRRIADERREARRSDDTDEERRHRLRARRGRRFDGARRNGGDRRRNGESAERPADGRREPHRVDGPADDEVTVRPRDGAERSRPGEDRDGAERSRPGEDRDGAERSRPGEDRDGAERSRPGEDRDEVVRADRIARDLGFGDGERRRDDRATRSRERRRRRDAVGRPYTDDDVGRFQFDTELRERPRNRPGRALRENQLEQLLVHETAASEGLSKPYLTSLPDAYAAERLLFDWLEFLVLKGGYKRTMDALRYYRTVEWLTAEVEAELRDYLVGFSGEVSDTDAYDVDDHHLSLVYIARLSSMT